MIIIIYNRPVHVYLCIYPCRGYAVILSDYNHIIYGVEYVVRYFRMTLILFFNDSKLHAHALSFAILSFAIYMYAKTSN